MSILGTGSSGDVILATRNGRRYAQKTLNNTCYGISGFLEALFMCGNDNEHIGKASIIEFDDESQRVFLLSPLAVGSASAFRKKEISLSLNEMKDFTIQLLRGLEYIHSFNIIHRDIKPSNVLVYEVDGELRYRIIDFGLCVQAKRIKGEAYTIYYRAPEVWKDYYDNKADIWALGCSLYEIYHHKVLFPLKSHLNRERVYRDGLDILYSSNDPFDIFLQSMLSKDPNKRKTSTELLQSKFLGNQIPLLQKESIDIDVESIAHKLQSVLSDEEDVMIATQIVALKISGGEIPSALLSQISQERLYEIEKELIIACTGNNFSE